MIEWLRSLTANSLAYTEINDVRIRHFGGGYIFKRRRWYAAYLIFFGNIVMRMRPVPVRVLPCTKWFAWEKTLYRELYGSQENLCRDGWLIVKKAPGVTVQDYLRNFDAEKSRKVRAMVTAGKALLHIHRKKLRKSGIALSHGDATVRNVMYDAPSALSQWFDFDLRHDLSVEAEKRQGDDLRALLFSALPYLTSEEFGCSAGEILRHVHCRKVLKALRCQVHSRFLEFDCCHLAQTLAPLRKRQKARKILLEIINQLLD